MEHELLASQSVQQTNDATTGDRGGPSSYPVQQVSNPAADEVDDSASRTSVLLINSSCFRQGKGIIHWRFSSTDERFYDVISGGDSFIAISHQQAVMSVEGDLSIVISEQATGKPKLPQVRLN